jgi:antitoxin CptB
MVESDADRQAYLRKLCFRASRRGFLEADLILGPFAVEETPRMSDAELLEFEQLLEIPDHDLYAWIIGREPTPANLDTELMGRLRDFRLRAHAARKEAD